jgi:hypothetical protein
MSATKVGALLFCHAARCILTEVVHSRVMEPMFGLSQWEHALRAGIARKVTALSACCRISMPRTYEGPSKIWNRLLVKSNNPKASKLQPMHCEPTTLHCRVQSAGLVDVSALCMLLWRALSVLRLNASGIASRA